MKTFRAAIWLLSIAVSVLFPAAARAQGAAGAGTSKTSAEPTPAVKHVSSGSTSYTKPTDKQKFRNYLFDSFGPYAWLSVTASAGIQQAKNAAPEWGQGADAYGVRVASNFGVNWIATTTRYGVSEIFREDTIYYRCDCTGAFPRIEHALISTLSARRGDDGHRVFSIANLVAPYAGTLTAALNWYPQRYKAMDGIRMGNFALLDYAAVNLAKEFVYGGPHTLMGRARHKSASQND